jgi:hypothetical protein
MKRSEASEIADLLEALSLGGELPDGLVEELLKKDIPRRAKALQTGVHALSHFVTDSDIREKEPDYDRHCRKKLNRYAKAIRAEASSVWPMESK